MPPKKKITPIIPVKTCTIKTLPDHLWLKAAARAVELNPANEPAIQQFKQLLPGTILPPLHIAAMTTKYWKTGKVRLTVGFLDNPPADLQKRILSHMNAWSKYGNVNFVISKTDPQ